MAKVKQVNIAVTSITQKTQHNNTQPYVTRRNDSQLKEQRDDKLYNINIILGIIILQLYGVSLYWVLLC